MTAKQIVLASGSSSRRAMLSAAGVAFMAVPPDLDEAALAEELRRMKAGSEAIAMSLAEAKALAVSGARPDAFVIGGDQVLECEGVLFSKVKTRAEARNTLVALRGRSHRLVSTAVLAKEGRILWRGCDSATMTMRAFSDAFLEFYLDKEIPDILGSVGCYRIEGLGAQLFEQVAGDQFCVRGMPLLALLSALRALGALES